MEREPEVVNNNNTADVFQRPCSALTVDDVYDIAKLIGADVERLIDVYGQESAVGLVPKTVKVLELLERFASRNAAYQAREEELLRAFETLQLQQPKRRGVKDTDHNEIRVSDMVAF